MAGLRLRVGISPWPYQFFTPGGRVRPEQGSLECEAGAKALLTGSEGDTG